MFVHKLCTVSHCRRFKYANHSEKWWKRKIAAAQKCIVLMIIRYLTEFSGKKFAKLMISERKNLKHNCAWNWHWNHLSDVNVEAFALLVILSLVFLICFVSSCWFYVIKQSGEPAVSSWYLKINSLNIVVQTVLSSECVLSTPFAA